jgi:hypothetical protein
MQAKGIKHITSECTLRDSRLVANVDPKTATLAEIVKIRKIQTGYQVDGITGGLAVKIRSPKGPQATVALNLGFADYR